MYIKKCISFLFFVAILNSVSAQDNAHNSLDSFSAKFISSIRANEGQRVYIVTDRSVFRAGEYVWFKAFLINSVSQKLSNKTSFLFIDVVNDKDSVIKRFILDAGNKQLNARIHFPDSLTTGFYWLRAYTRHMAEQEPNKAFVKPLYVFAKNDYSNSMPLKKNVSNRNEAPVINFFPEGNNIITGINSVIALQATYKSGDALSIEGFIKDNRDTIVTHFATNENGLGKFEFEPSGFRKYKAVITWLGKEISYPLPAFDFNKGQLSATRQYNGYKLRILLGDSIYAKETPSYIIGVSKDSLVFAGIGNGQYEVNIDDRKLPPGITTFYLFDKDFNLLSERSVFINPRNLSVQITTDKTLYNKRDKISLDVSVKNAEQHFISSVIAVAVSDSSLSQIKSQCSLADIDYDLNAVDNLFLSGNNCFTDDDIDIMMMAKNNYFSTLTKNAGYAMQNEDENLLFIKGKVINNKKEAEANRVVTLLSNAGAKGIFITDTTDNKGEFVFPVYSYADSTQFAIEIKDMNNHVLNKEIVFDKIDYPIFKTPASLKKYPAIVPGLYKSRLNVYNNLELMDAQGHHLPPVTVKGDAKPVDYDVTKRVSQYSSILSGKDLDGRTSLDLVILRVSGLQLLNGYLVIHGLNALKSPGPSSEPLLLVEGVPVVLSADGVGTVSPVMSYLKTLNPKDVDFIEVLKSGDAANYGVRGANGVILINLSRSGRDISSPDNNMKLFYREGITNPSVFPAYNYDVKDKKSANVLDDRCTIFWNGSYLTTNNSNAAFTFYTSDVPSTYSITVSGFTASGDFINKTITIRSK